MNRGAVLALGGCSGRSATEPRVLSGGAGLLGGSIYAQHQKSRGNPCNRARST